LHIVNLKKAMLHTAQFRYYEELNDYLPVDKRKKGFSYEFTGNPTVIDVVESMGVPHAEIDLILANGTPVSFSYRLQDNDIISVYPVFESIDISPVIRLREKPLREPQFIVDVHLGKLAKYMRMAGFDTLYNNRYDKTEIVELAADQNRIILTRSGSVLKDESVIRGLRIMSSNPTEQLYEVIHRLDLYSHFRPFSRCMICNGLLAQTDKESILDLLHEKTKRYYDEFYRCTSCKKIYWNGSHYEKMKQFIEQIRKSCNNNSNM